MGGSPSRRRQSSPSQSGNELGDNKCELIITINYILQVQISVKILHNYCLILAYN